MTSKSLKTKCITVGDKVWLKKEVNNTKLKGCVRFIGQMLNKPPQNIYYGIELDSDCKMYGKTNGKMNGIQYFACQIKNTPKKSTKNNENYGIFVQKHKITKSRVPSSNEFHFRVSVGDSVRIQSGYKGQGIIRYIGQPMCNTKNAPVLYGIEMQRTGQGYSCGTYKNKWCFKCKPGKGIFVQKSQLKLAPHLTYKQKPKRSKSIISFVLFKYCTLLYFYTKYLCFIVFDGKYLYYRTSNESFRIVDKSNI